MCVTIKWLIKINKNNNEDKTVLLLLCISDLGKRSGCKNIYDLINKKIKGNYRVKKKMNSQNNKLESSK